MRSPAEREALGRTFEAVVAATFRSVQRATPAQVLDSLASRSYVIAMGESERRTMLGEVAAAVPPGDVIEHPLVTAAFWARRR